MIASTFSCKLKLLVVFIWLHHYSISLFTLSHLFLKLIITNINCITHAYMSYSYVHFYMNTHIYKNLIFGCQLLYNKQQLLEFDFLMSVRKSVSIFRKWKVASTMNYMVWPVLSYLYILLYWPYAKMYDFPF